MNDFLDTWTNASKEKYVRVLQKDVEHLENLKLEYEKQKVTLNKVIELVKVDEDDEVQTFLQFQVQHVERLDGEITKIAQSINSANVILELIKDCDTHDLLLMHMDTLRPVNEQ